MSAAHEQARALRVIGNLDSALGRDWTLADGRIRVTLVGADPERGTVTLRHRSQRRQRVELTMWAEAVRRGAAVPAEGGARSAFTLVRRAS
ncbi:MAG: hypothetical protein NUV51_04485 [Sulfuricaulis sp.]|nr:hypothetical protein [Sulfuricaulis sp.]